MVDVDDVVLIVNSDTVTADSYGNPLVKKSWFVLNLPIGDYTFTFNHAAHDAQTRVITLNFTQIATLNIVFLPPSSKPEPSKGRIKVQSVPDGAAILVDGTVLDDTSPAELKLEIGEHTVELVSPEWEPLSYTVMVDSLHISKMKYYLRPLPPQKITAESLGLDYEMEIPLLDEKRAEVRRRRFNSLTETFAIIPFGQGLLGKVLLEDEDQGIANALLISGAVLSTGLYILGKVLSARELRKIKQENEEINAFNLSVAEHNNEIDQIVKQTNHKAYQDWLKKYADLGHVQVSKE